MTMKLNECINMILEGNKEGFSQVLKEHVEKVVAFKLNEGAILEDDDELAEIIEIEMQARSCGGEAEYEDGIFECTFRKKQQVIDFADLLDENDNVYSYEVIVLEKIDGADVEVDVDIDEIQDDIEYNFVVMVYLSEDAAAYDLDFVEDDSLEEVRRRIKVNAQGKKRIKMQCRKGFKWNGTTCVKISGEALAKSRIAKRKMVLNKRSQGAALKIKVLRKTRKAKRFRKAFGLREDVMATSAVATHEKPLGSVKKRINESHDCVFHVKGQKDATVAVSETDGKYLATVTINGVQTKKEGDKQECANYIQKRVKDASLVLVDGKDVLGMADLLEVEEDLNESYFYNPRVAVALDFDAI